MKAKLKLIFWILLGLGVVFGIGFNFPQSADQDEFVAHLDDIAENASLSLLFRENGAEELLNAPLPVRLRFPVENGSWGSAIPFIRFYDTDSGRVVIHVRSHGSGTVSFYEIAFEPGSESHAQHFREVIRAEFPGIWSRLKKL